MIILCEIPEHYSRIERAHNLMGRPNIIVRRGGMIPKPEVYMHGEIRIPDFMLDSPEDVECAVMHECGHLGITPASLFNHTQYMYDTISILDVKVKYIDKDFVRLLDAVLNVAEDLVIENHIASTENRWLMRRFYMRYYRNYRRSGKKDILMDVLYKCLSRIYDFNVDVELEPDPSQTIVEVIRNNRVEEAVPRVASIIISFLKLPENTRKQHKLMAELSRERKTGDIRFTRVEYERAIDEILLNSRNYEEAVKKVKLLNILASTRGEDVKVNINLRKFYEAKARMVEMVALPRVKTGGYVEAGSETWDWESVEKIDIERTIEDHGLPVPPLLQARRMEFRVGAERKTSKIYVAVDTSGSTGMPNGSMLNVIEYEIIGFYCIVDSARRRNMPVGLMLWNKHLYHTERAEREYDKIKDAIFKYARFGGGTELTEVLLFISRCPDSFFIILTDGACHIKRYAADMVRHMRNWIALVYNARGSLKEYKENIRVYWEPVQLGHKTVFVGHYRNLPRAMMEVVRRVCH